MSPAQFSTGILSIFDMNSLSRLQSLQISLKYISYFHSLDPKACIFLPQEPATWLLPLCPSSWGCLSFFPIHKSKHASFLPKGPPRTGLHPCWQSHFCCSWWHFLTVVLGCQPLTSSISLCTPCSCLGTPLPTSFVQPALPRASRSRSFLWDAFPDLPRESGSFLLPCSHLYCGSY